MAIEIRSGSESIPSIDYTSVTELPGSRATREQQARLYHRYRTASRYAMRRRVLEVGCGAGLGLGYLGRLARSVVGADYTENLLRMAQSHYRGRIPLVRLDGHHLPFRNESFDLVLISEAIYYFSHAENFIAESRRVLSQGGKLVICTVNKDWSEFTPSLLSIRYFSVSELKELLTQQGFSELEFFGAFPTVAVSPKQKIVSLIRRVAVTLNLVPKTLGGRQLLKRLFYGSSSPLDHEVKDGVAELYPLTRIADASRDCPYKILYALARPR